MRRWLTLLAVLLLAGCDATAEDRLAEQVGGLRGRLLVRTDGGYVRNGVGTTVRLKDGRLLHLVTRHRPRRGVSPDHWPADIAAMTSADEGRSWTRPRPLFRGPGPSAVQPGLARLANGELGVAYSRIDGPASARAVFRRSADEGRTWSEEIPLSPTGGYWTSAHDRLLRLSSGRLVIPLHMKLVVRPERMATRVAWSDDNGRSWRLSPQVLTVEAMIPAYRARPVVAAQAGPGFWEASIAERADGSLLMLGRTYAGSLHAATSADGGVSWTEPVPTSLVTGASPGRLERLPGSEGRLLVVWNRCCLDPASALLGRRLTLSAAVSSDGGATWEVVRDLEAIAPRGRVDYPAILVSDGWVLVAYKVGGRPLAPHGSQEYLAVLPLAGFTADGPVGAAKIAPAR